MDIKKWLMKDQLRSGYYIGATIAVSILMGMQDFVGQEKYIQLARDWWWEMHWGWWLGVIAVCSYAYLKILKWRAEDGKTRAGKSS